MNILLVTPFDLSTTGGVCTAVRMLCAEFSKKGHRVSVLLPGETNRVLPIDATIDVPCYGIYLRVPFIKGALLRGFLTFWLFLPITLLRVYRFTAQKRINAVAIQYPLPWVFYFALLRRICPWKLVVTLQGNDVHDLPDVSWVDRLFVKWLLVAADRVVAVSRSLLEKVWLMFPHLSLNTCVVPNGAPIDKTLSGLPVEVDEDMLSDYILTVGQIIHRKGMDLLIKAMNLAHERGHILNLVIVGEGPEHSNLLALATQLGLSSNVYFVGNQSHEKTLEFFRGCLFFALASRAEGLPLVIVEAMASEKAVVATRIDGVPEIVQDGQTGLLVEPENAEALAEALVTLYKDPKLRLRLARQGREHVLNRYSWEAIAARYVSIFEGARV